MFLRKIKDIKIQNNEISAVRDARISVKELEGQIAKLTYSGANKIKDKSAELAKLPPFIQVFYYHFFAYLRIPSEKEVFDTYIEWLGGDLNGYLKIEGKEYELELIRYRFLRTYPSLIRDLHFLYLLQESGLFEQVEYSMENDYFRGLDLKIINNNNIYYISVFIDTKRSKHFKKKKAGRHDYTVIKEIELKVNFSSMKLFGNIYLLNDEHVKILKDQIMKNEESC